MKIKEEVLSIIYLKFPQHAVLIEDLFDGSDNFRFLCEDYHECVRMLASLTDKKNRDRKILKEYTTLKKEIEQELEEEIMSRDS